MNATTKAFDGMDRAGERRRGKRLEEIALALALIMTGAMWLAPEGILPDGAWLAGAGLILLGLNGARRAYGIRVSGFGISLGFVAVAAGIARILGRELPFWPALLIVLGVALIVKAAAAPGKNPGRPAAV